MDDKWEILTEFGTKAAIGLVLRRFSNYPTLKDIDPATIDIQRKDFNYGVDTAKDQWVIASDHKVPDSEEETCFICGLDFNTTKIKDWRSPQVEHLLPSAFAFLLFGLPGKFHLKWRNDDDEACRIIYKEAVEFGEIVRNLQVKNFLWCHAVCNLIKKDKIFIEAVKITRACKSDRYGDCEVDINESDDIDMNRSVVMQYVTGLLGKAGGKMGDEFRRRYRGDIFSLKNNIYEAFENLVNTLSSYSKDHLIDIIQFNLLIGISIVSKYLDKDIPISRANKIKGLCDRIKNNHSGKRPMKGGVHDDLLTKEEFEDFLRIGEAIKYYADLPYPGKEEDDAFIKEYMVDYQGELEVPEVPLRINIPQRMNVMNNTPRVATPRVATPVRGKRSRNNNVNEPQNNMRNENYISKTLASKKPRVTRNFRPNRRPFTPLSQMQIAGKYKKTRKNRR